MRIQYVMVPNPDELIAAYGVGAKLRVARSSDGVTYSEIAASPELLVSRQNLYTFDDGTGVTGDWYRSWYSDTGNLDRSDYSAPWQVPDDQDGYCSLLDVRQRYAADNTNIGSEYDQTIVAKINEITADLDREIGQARGVRGGWTVRADAVASERLFIPPAGGSTILAIDDCVEITSVAVMVNPTTVSQVLVAGTDYVTSPMRGTPIIRLRSLTGRWADGALIRVIARWGLADTIPTDIREVAIIEVIRSRMGDQAGNTDVIGATPFGTAQVSKAYSSKFYRLVKAYGIGGGFIR